MNNINKNTYNSTKNNNNKLPSINNYNNPSDNKYS